MPPKPKAKNAPNQHDKRHESGLAAPGKRVTKQRSNGHLNGHPNGKPPADNSSALPALPSTGLNQGFRFPRPVAASGDVNHTHTVAKHHAIAPDVNLVRERTSSEASVDPERGSSIDMAADMLPDHASAANPLPETHASSYKSNMPSASLSSTFSTILANYPLRDAISILILLLSLPPTLVLVIQTLFASLTFVPPTAGISLSTLPNVKEMFNASNLGYPAMATIFIVDLIFWTFWLPMWKPVQNIFLDLSQAVIAVSLSGAAASSSGPTYSIATCTLIVCAVHVLRYKAIHLTALDYLRSVLHKMDIGVPLEASPLTSSLFSSIPVERGWAMTVIRTILGIHIVSQGVTTCIRRSLVKANERDQNAPITTRVDSEAAIGTDTAPRAGPSHSDPTPQSIPEVRTPANSSPSPRDSKGRETSTKKKKKQANQVRSQQPLWAAIASTKVTFVKEMEQRDAADDARDASVMNKNNKTTAFANSITTDSSDRIWISEVRDNEIFFSVDLSSDSARESADRLNEGVTISSGIDKSKPFYVRVNGASWSSTRIMSSATGKQSENRDGGCYDGEIFGLASLSSYHCEIIGMASGRVLCTTSLITQAAPSAEQAAAMVPQPQPALRPSSPTSTLKQSIVSAEAKTSEIRNRAKKSRKELRGVNSEIRKDINSLKTKLDSSGGFDEKQERRLQQINQHKTQAEEATAEIKQQIDLLGEIPSDELAQSDGKRSVWQSAYDAKDAASRDFVSTRTESDREITGLKSEMSSLESKLEKLNARKVQRGQELEKLTFKQQADSTAKQKREEERSQILRSREEEESQMRFHIATMESEVSMIQQKTQDAYHQVVALQSWSSQPPPAYSSPPTPEGNLPGTNGSFGVQSNGFSSAFPPPFVPSQSPASGTKKATRGRSSSMLSQYSGFTEDGTDVGYSMPPPTSSWPMDHHATAGAGNTDDHGDSEGSRSGSNANNSSTGSNSPRPDAKPFYPAPLSPIAPPSKSREKSSGSPAHMNGSTVIR